PVASCDICEESCGAATFWSGWLTIRVQSSSTRTTLPGCPALPYVSPPLAGGAPKRAHKGRISNPTMRQRLFMIMLLEFFIVNEAKCPRSTGECHGCIHISAGTGYVSRQGIGIDGEARLDGHVLRR